MILLKDNETDMNLIKQSRKELQKDLLQDHGLIHGPILLGSSDRSKRFGMQTFNTKLVGKSEVPMHYFIKL